MSYDTLKNRLMNGTAFVKQTAIDRINALADSLEITQEQGEELLALAQANGVDVLPEDFTGRLAAVEAAAAKFEIFLEAAGESTLLNTILERMQERLDEGGAAV